MNNQSVKLQDHFLNHLRKESVPATFYLVNGFQLKGIVKGFDNFIIILDSEGKQMMIYKHAVSTISPTRTVNLNPSTPEEGNEKI